MHYNPMSDLFRGSIVASDGSLLTTHSSVCYAGMLDERARRHFKEAEYYDVFWVDSLTRYYGNSLKSDQAIKELQDLNLFRNIELTILTREEFLVQYPNHSNMTNGKRWFRLRSRINIDTPQESFFVGCIMRLFASSPRIIRDWLRLIKLYGKEYKHDHLLILAHSISWTKAQPTQMMGHLFVYSSFGMLTGKTFEDQFNRHDNMKFKPIRLSTDYRGLTNDDFFVRLSASGHGRYRGLKHVRGCLETYFNEDSFDNARLHNRTLYQRQ
jgi:hypothetical protein